MKAWMSSNFYQIPPPTPRVICPCASEKLMYKVVNTLAPLFLIGYSLYWQVTRTFITSRTSSKFGQIGPRTAELAALGNKDMHESLDEFQFGPDTTTYSRVICPCASEKLMYNVVNTLAPLFLIGSSSYWQATRTSITSRTSSKFGLDTRVPIRSGQKPNAAFPPPQ